MIPAISGINFNKKRLENPSKKCDCLPSLNKDTFELNSKSIPSFSGGRFCEEIFGFCDIMLEKVMQAQTPEQVMEYSKEFSRGLNSLVAERAKKLIREELEETEEDKAFFVAFIHEGVNSAQELAILSEPFNDAAIFWRKQIGKPFYKIKGSEILKRQKTFFKRVIPDIKNCKEKYAETLAKRQAASTET